MIRRLMGPGTSGFGGIALAAMGTGCPASAAANWWDPNGDGLCIWSAYQPKGAADLAGSYVDLSGNGNNAGVGVAPTWDAVNGWKFNGTTQYLTTTFVSQVDQSQTMIVQFTNLQTDGSSKALCGSRNGPFTDRWYIYASYNADSQVIYGNGGSGVVAPNLVAGNLCVAGAVGYRNGAFDIGVAAGAVVPTWPTWIGGYNRSGVLTSPSQVYIQAFALYDCTLTAPQVLAVTTAMAAL